MSVTTQGQATVAAARLLPFVHEAWRDAAIECTIALHAWLASDPAGRRAAYVTYRAALDREQAAAQDLQQVCATAQPLAAAAAQ